VCRGARQRFKEEFRKGQEENVARWRKNPRAEVMRMLMAESGYYQANMYQAAGSSPAMDAVLAERERFMPGEIWNAAVCNMTDIYGSTMLFITFALWTFTALHFDWGEGRTIIWACFQVCHCHCAVVLFRSANVVFCFENCILSWTSLNV